MHAALWAQNTLPLTRPERHQLARQLTTVQHTTRGAICCATANTDEDAGPKLLRSLSDAGLQVSRSFADLEHRLGSLLSADPLLEANQEGNEWMLDTREYEFTRVRTTKHFSCSSAT